MSHSRAFKILILLLTVSIILTASIIVIKNSSPKLTGTSGSVLPANVIWEKTNVMVGWTDPPGQPALIGKARYMFYIVNLTYPQNTNWFSSLQFISYVGAAFAILLAVLLVVFKLRHKPNTNQTSKSQSKNKP